MFYKYLITTALSIIMGFLVFFPAWHLGESHKVEKKATAQSNQLMKGQKMKNKVQKSEQEWKEILSDEEYRILRKKGTEHPFSGKYNDFKGKGIYKCAGCGNELFSSETKYHSGSGWPSFWAPITAEKVDMEQDRSLFMERTEVVCSRCGGHLGHVFNDGPAPTHQRYCINSVSLDFDENKSKVQQEKK